MNEEKRINGGYEIIESCTIGSNELVIGHNPKAPNPYVCWYCKNGKEYFWGYYCNELSSAREKLNDGSLIRVASKYPRIAKDYFYNTKHQTVEIIKLNGSVELAPIVGLSEVIVDIVETGSTLKENGLQVLEEICPLSARVVVNEVSMKMEHERITKLVKDLKKIVSANQE